MNRPQLESIANNILAEYQLNPVRVELCTAKRRLGVNYPTRRLIKISSYILGHPQVEDTIRHEVAHQIAYDKHGHGVGHDYRWKALARTLGASPTACASSSDLPTPPTRWNFTCESGCTFGYYRKPTAILSRGARCKKHHLQINRV